MTSDTGSTIRASVSLRTQALKNSFNILTNSPSGAVIWARKLVASETNPRGMARAAAVVAGSVSTAILVATAGRAVLACESLVAHTLSVVADTVVGAGVRAGVAGAVHSGVPKVAVASSVLALSMVGAAVRAFLSGALGTSPSLEAVASAVVALSIVVTVSRAGTDGTVSTDPSGWTQTLAIQTASTERAIVQANLI